MSMTKVSPTSFQFARVCFVASGVMPFVTLWYLAIQFQMLLWQRAIFTVLGAIGLGRLLWYLLSLVNENEAAHATELKRPQKFSVQCGANIGDSYSENLWA